jgi:hypothetical protein
MMTAAVVQLASPHDPSSVSPCQKRLRLRYA